MTLSWTNPLTGNGSTALVYPGSGASWTTGCFGQSSGFKATFACVSGTIVLTVFFLVGGGPCPAGSYGSCQSNGSGGSGNLLAITSHTCSPLSLTYTTGTGSQCPTLYADGFTGFTVTSP